MNRRFETPPTPFVFLPKCNAMGVAKRGEPFGSWETKWAESWNTQTFLYFFFPLIFVFFFFFFFPVRGLRCCNLGTRRLMAGQSPLDVASVRFLTHVTLSPVTFRLFIHQRPLRRNPRPFIDDVYLLGRFISLSLCVCVCLCAFFPF